MPEDFLFRMALAPATLFISARFVVWPIFTAGLLVLIFFRIKPIPAWGIKLVFVRRAMASIAIFLGLSLALAYITIPGHDKQAGVFWYGALLGSLPVLVPSAIAVLFKPTPRTAIAARTTT